MDGIELYFKFRLALELAGLAIVVICLVSFILLGVWAHLRDKN